MSQVRERDPVLRGAAWGWAAPLPWGVYTMYRLYRIVNIDSHGKTPTISTFVQKNTIFLNYKTKREKKEEGVGKGSGKIVFCVQPIFSPEKRIRETQFSLFFAATEQRGRTTP